MAVSYSGKLSNNTIFQSDNDDLTVKIWKVRKEKEKLQEEIDAQMLEIDGWLQVLECSSAAELDTLIDDFASTPSILPKSFKILHPSPERDHLAQYSDLVTKLNALEIMDYAQGYATLDGNILIKFPMKPPRKENKDFFILLKPEEQNTYSVVGHNLPPSVSLNTLEEKYLKNPEKEDGLKSFIAVVGQHAKAFHLRLQQIVVSETLVALEGSKVMHNSEATNLCFLINMKWEQTDFETEFVLKFEALDILPYSVKAKPISLGKDQAVPGEFQTVLDNIAERMTKNSFTQVILEEKYFTSSSPPDTQEGPSTSSRDIEDSGPLFDEQD